MKYHLTVFILSICNYGLCQSIGGKWVGQMTHPLFDYKNIKLEAKITQIDSVLNGQIKTSCDRAYIITRFQGVISNGKITINESEVLEESQEKPIWCLKSLEGVYNGDNGSHVINGTWTTYTAYKNEKPQPYFECFCPPGVFSISSSSSLLNKPFESTTSEASTIGERVHKEKSLYSSFIKPNLIGFVSVWFGFEQSSSSILPSSKAALDKVLNYLTKYPSLEILLEGHTDNVGDPVENLNLSARRVMIIKQFLVGNGISSERISCHALGGMLPIAPNDSEKNRSLNRRVLVKVVKE